MTYIPIEEILNPYPSEVYKKRKRKGLFIPSSSHTHLMFLILEKEKLSKEDYRKIYYDEATAIRAIKKLKEKGYLTESTKLTGKALNYLRSVV